MLNLVQSRELNRANRLSLYLIDNNIVYKAYKPFAKQAQLFIDNKTLLAKLAVDKEASGTHETLNKNQLKHSVIDKLIVICSIAHAYAEEVSNAELLVKLDITETQIIGLKDTDVLPFVTNICGLFTPELFADDKFKEYEINAAEIADVLADATAFNGKIGVADVVNTTASTANVQMNNTIKLMRGNIAQMHKLVVKFKKDKPDFVKGFAQNSVLENTGLRHSGVEGTVTVNGIAAAGATVSLVGTNKTAITDANGNYSIVKVKTGDYQVQVAASGSEAVVKPVHISQGHIDTIDFAL